MTFEVRATVESVRSNLIDVTTFADLPNGQFIPGECAVSFRSRAGSFSMPWTEPLPAIGDVFIFSVRKLGT